MEVLGGGREPAENMAGPDRKYDPTRSEGSDPSALLQTLHGTSDIAVKYPAAYASMSTSPPAVCTFSSTLLWVTLCALTLLPRPADRTGPWNPFVILSTTARI
eukprot:10194682-Ditylum_brightwellii.AAC.1